MHANLLLVLAVNLVHITLRVVTHFLLQVCVIGAARSFRDDTMVFLDFDSIRRADLQH